VTPKRTVGIGEIPAERLVGVGQLQERSQQPCCRGNIAESITVAADGWARTAYEKSDVDEVHRDKVMSVLCQPGMAGIGLDRGDVLVGAGEAVRFDAASVIGGSDLTGGAGDIILAGFSQRT
jgi:hypothetical protein